MVAVIENSPLLVFLTYDGKKFYKEVTIEEYRENKPSGSSLREIVFSCGTRMKYSNIKSVRNANSVEYFEYFVLPKLPKDEKFWWKNRVGLIQQAPKLEIILQKLKEYRKEKFLYLTTPDSEKRLRIKEIIEQHRKKYPFLR